MTLLLGCQCFTETRCLRNRGINFSTLIKIHGVLCQKSIILIQSWQPQPHACFNKHITSRRPPIALWPSTKTGWNKWRQVIASLWRLQRKQAFITTCFCTARFPHKFLRLLNYSTFKYATEYFNCSIPVHYLQTWDRTSNAYILLVIFHCIVIQYNRGEQHAARGSHQPTWVRCAALVTFTNNYYLKSIIIVCKFKIKYCRREGIFNSGTLRCV